jgi:exopolyphosphatase/guanosine-5'-triphosphate,3'-diphosphate pyrophosphatase
MNFDIIVNFLVFSYNHHVKNRTFASLDIGTNTFRLLIAEIHHQDTPDNYSIHEIYSERIITRIGEGLQETGTLKRTAMERSIETLQKFREIISRYNVHKTSAIATSALREAKNRSSFLKEVEDKTGFEIEIISGEQEAELTATGMLIDMVKPHSAFMIDIGGGSTELIVLRNNQPLLKQSLNLGVVYLAGAYMKHDPPLTEDLTSMGEEITQQIASVAPYFKEFFSEETILIGTAGTVTTLASVAQGLSSFDHKRIHNHKLSLEIVKNIFLDIATIHSRDRAAYIPFEPERLDIIVPGTLILLRLMEMFSFNEMTVSNYGLREGILIKLYNSVVG